jgi:hypothetical protein
MREGIRPPVDDGEGKIMEGWARFSREYTPGGLNEQEEAQFARARFAEEQAKKTGFVLGGPLKISL